MLPIRRCEQVTPPNTLRDEGNSRDDAFPESERLRWVEEIAPMLPHD